MGLLTSISKKFDLGCVQNSRVEDIDDDGNHELIIESGGGGTGIYCKKEYLFFSQDISSPINSYGSRSATVLGPAGELLELIEEIKK